MDSIRGTDTITDNKSFEYKKIQFILFSFSIKHILAETYLRLRGSCFKCPGA